MPEHTLFLTGRRRQYVSHVFNMAPRSKSFAAAAAAAAIAWLLCSWVSSVAEDIRYSPASRQVVEARLGRYAGNNMQRELTLKQMFAEAGCGDQHVSEQRVKGSKLPNLICTLPGSSDKVIIVGAHFDRTAEGDGVVDNWSGASLLPSLYAALKTVPRQHTYVFIGFTDEEEGEVGSHFYVRQMTREQAAATDAMVNIDTLGLAPTKVWVRRSDQRLARLLAYIATRMNLPMAAVNVDQVGSSDGEQFAKVKIPRITIHSLTQETWNAAILHTSKDRFSAIRLDDYYQSYRLLSAYVALLDQFSRTLEIPTAHPKQN